MDGSNLKSHQYYSDLYDRGTVELCRRTEASFKKVRPPSPKLKKYSKEQLEQLNDSALKFYLHFETGERYAKKAETIREWMDADRKKDEMYESAKPPEDIRCLTCRNRVEVSFKHLWSQMDKPDRVLFMFDCPNKCMPRRAFFSDGEEWRVKPNLCPKCNSSLIQSEEDTGEKAITTYKCPNCEYSRTSEYVWHKKEDDIDENFAKDRDRFCLTEEDGRKYQDEKYRMEGLGKIMEEFKEKEKAREERLAANPKGFHLEGRYSCGICGQTPPEGDIWYDKWSMKCLICQMAIDKKEIPGSVAKDKESWYSNYDLDSAFNLKAATVRKWVREGILKSRVISVYGKRIHKELFLIKDNKDFLPPKDLVKSRSVSEVKDDGKTWYHSEPWYRFVDPFEHLKDYGIMKLMRVVPEEEMKQREEEKASKQKAKEERRERLKAVRAKKKNQNERNYITTRSGFYKAILRHAHERRG